MSLLNEFCAEFGLTEADIGHVTRLGRRCFLTVENQGPLMIKLKNSKNDVFGAGVYLGEEKQRLEPSAALLEIISSKTKGHKVVVDERAAWLFLCGRDILDKGVVRAAEPTRGGYLLVQDERDENLGYGRDPTPRDRKRGHDMAVKNLLDRGNFLRRERFE
jgi:ribosome biogenesis protein Nip4